MESFPRMGGPRSRGACAAMGWNGWRTTYSPPLRRTPARRCWEHAIDTPFGGWPPLPMIPFLPPSLGAAIGEKIPSSPLDWRGSGCVLVVDDEDPVRVVVARA